MIARGALRLDPGMENLSGVTVRIQLLDVSYQDAPAVVLDEVVIPDIDHQAGTEDEIAFELRAQDVPPTADLTVRAHIDCVGDGAVHQGDYLTMTSYPVAPAAETAGLVVDVQRVE